MNVTKIVQGDRTVFIMPRADGADIRRLLAEQKLAGAHPDKTIFRTYLGSFTLAELERYLYG